MAERIPLFQGSTARRSTSPLSDDAGSARAVVPAVNPLPKAIPEAVVANSSGAPLSPPTGSPSSLPYSAPVNAAPIAIEFSHVSKAFGKLQVLQDVSFRLVQGQTTVIVGPSGTGKSVLLKHIVGLLLPDSGSVRVLGQEVTTLKGKELTALRKRFGMLFQDGALFGSMTVGENVAFPLLHHTRLSPARIKEIVADKLHLVGLSGIENKSPAELSGGMRKRVALARAIVMEPEIVLFDEPHSGLDPMTADAIDELILEMKERLRITFVVISHDIVGTFKIADAVGMLYQGKLVEFGTPEALKRSQNPVVRQFLARNLTGSPLESFDLAAGMKG